MALGRRLPAATARQKLPLPCHRRSPPCISQALHRRLLLTACHPVPATRCCPQTLQLYWRRGRYADFVLFFTGFVLALIYHWLHMHPEVRCSASCSGSVLRQLAATGDQGAQAAACSLWHLPSAARTCTAAAAAIGSTTRLPPPSPSLRARRASPTRTSWACPAPPGAAWTF